MSQGSVIFNRVLGSLASTIDPDDYAAVVSGDDIVESSGYGNRDVRMPPNVKCTYFSGFLSRFLC